jgi:[ribosomal protein S18]-alanine N-acetyltransferase
MTRDHRSTAPVHFRRATLADVPALAALEVACFYHKSEAFNRRQVRYLVGDTHALVTVAEDAGGGPPPCLPPRGRGESGGGGASGGRIVGWSVGLMRNNGRGKGKTGRLYAVAVHPDCRGQSLGRRLVAKLLADFAGRGIRRVFLEVRTDNHPAIALYHSLGFTVRHTLHHYYSRCRHAVSMVRERTTP